MQATIIFKDGDVMSVEMNGDCYITQTKPEFPEDLSTVTVQSEDGERVYHDAVLVECASIDGRYWFTFNELSPLEKTIAMLTDCILEMSEIIYG